MPIKFRFFVGLILGVNVMNAAPLIVDRDHSSVEVVVKATIGSFVASIQDFDLSVALTTVPPQIQTGEFRFRFASIKTGDLGRDRDMNEWQQTDRYPVGVFVLTAIGPAENGTLVARGRLKFHGVERAMSFPIKVMSADRAITIEGQVAIDTRDFGLSVIKKFVVLKVDPTVQLRFHIVGIRGGP